MGLGRIRKALLGISFEETTFERRGFRDPGTGVREHLEKVGHHFVTGYNTALEESRPSDLARRLDAAPAAFRGFTYEGAAMAVALLDVLLPWRSRLQQFLDGPGDPHTYLVHVGAGWALARLPVRPERFLRRLDHPERRWLAMDGYGFHEGYFHARDRVERRRVPRRVRDYGRRAFDQGLGRSLWFVRGADVDAIAETIERFDDRRHEDLWSGVGLAVTYAGGVGRPEVERLAELSGPHRAALAQGAIFAAEARHRAGNLVPATEMACEALCGVTAAQAAAWSRECGDDLPPDDPREPGFEVWRRRLMERWRQQWNRKMRPPKTRRMASSAATG